MGIVMATIPLNATHFDTERVVRHLGKRFLASRLVFNEAAKYELLSRPFLRGYLDSPEVSLFSKRQGDLCG